MDVSWDSVMAVCSSGVLAAKRREPLSSESLFKAAKQLKCTAILETPKTH